jgi:hypothetical protein
MVLLHPAGSVSRSTVKPLAGLPSSVAKLTFTDWAPAPTTATTWPLGDATASMLLLTVAE